MTQKTLIRFAEPQDLNELILLCKAHAYFEKTDYQPQGKALALKKHLFKPSPSLFCLVLEQQNKLIGYCTYMKKLSPWDCDFYLYLDCLFIYEEFGGMGLTAQIMKRIQEAALSMGIEFLQWQTPEFDKDAIRFYNKLGAESIDKERFLLKVDRQ